MKVQPRPPQTRAELKKLIEWLAEPGAMEVWLRRIGVIPAQGDPKDGGRWESRATGFL